MVNVKIKAHVGSGSSKWIDVIVTSRTGNYTLAWSLVEERWHGCPYCRGIPLYVMKEVEDTLRAFLLEIRATTRYCWSK